MQRLRQLPFSVHFDASFVFSVADRYEGLPGLPCVGNRCCRGHALTPIARDEATKRFTQKHSYVKLVVADSGAEYDQESSLRCSSQWHGMNPFNGTLVYAASPPQQVLLPLTSAFRHGLRPLRR